METTNTERPKGRIPGENGVRPGILITIEGDDGEARFRAAYALRSAMAACGLAVTDGRDPEGLGGAILDHLAGHDGRDMEAIPAALLALNAVALIESTRIRPALTLGAHVVASHHRGPIDSAAVDCDAYGREWIDALAVAHLMQPALTIRIGSRKATPGTVRIARRLPPDEREAQIRRLADGALRRAGHRGLQDYHNPKPDPKLEEQTR